MADFQARNQGSTENSQNVGRPVLLGTLFGLLMLLTLAAGVLAAVGRTPRMAAFVVLLLWVVTGVVLVVGAGAPIRRPRRMGAYLALHITWPRSLCCCYGCKTNCETE